MVIYLPSLKINEIAPGDSIIVQTKRKHPKIQYTFHVKNEIVFDDGGDAALPEYPGGIEKFKNYIRQQLTYPEKAIENNIEGTVEIEFTIGLDGGIKNISATN